MPLQRDPENNEKKYLHKFADLKDKHILEVGCGEGRLTWKYANASKSIIGFDVDKDAIRIAQADAVINASQHVLFFNANAKHIPLAKETFDIALGSLSLCCIADEDKIDALNETRRLLKPNGIFIDLRALESNWQVEVCDSAQSQITGRLNDSPGGVEHDEGAFKAMREVESKRWYIKEKEEEFDFFYYWDTPSEMKEFMEDEWEGFEKIDEDVYRKTSGLWVSAGADARVRVRVKMHIARWKKI